MFVSYKKTNVKSHSYLFKVGRIITMKNLTQNERQLFILRLLTGEDVFLSALRLAEKFNVSPKTIRQDIRKLSHLGLVSREKLPPFCSKSSLI